MTYDKSYYCEHSCANMLSRKILISNYGENSVNGQDIREVTMTTKEMLESIKDLINELTSTVSVSKDSIVVSNIKDTVNEVSDIYKKSAARTD